MQSTQHYIDNERNFIANISQNQPTEVIEFKTAILPVVEQVDIDTDIEREITKLQEAKINEGIKKVVPVDFDAELGSFFSSIAEEKNQLKEKVKKEVVKIDALEDLFKELSSVKKKKVVKKKEKVLLVEPEKIEEPVIEEVIVEKTPAELTTIERVSKQLSEMQVATELDKDKLRGLESIDSLEKLKKEFLNFKDIVAVQMGTIGGGGSVRILDNEDVDISSIGNGKILEYNSTTEKMQFVTSGDSVTNLEVLGSITFEGSNDFILGKKIVYRAVAAPFQKILTNAGHDIVEVQYLGSKLTDSEKENNWAGLNYKNLSTIDFKEAGIIDPKKVTRIALENAASVAGTILTTESVIYEKKEDKEEQNPQQGMM